MIYPIILYVVAYYIEIVILYQFFKPLLMMKYMTTSQLTHSYLKFYKLQSISCYIPILRVLLLEEISYLRFHKSHVNRHGLDKPPTKYIE